MIRIHLQIIIISWTLLCRLTWRHSKGMLKSCTTRKRKWIRSVQGYIFPKNWIFLPHHPFSKFIFFPPNTVKISPFSRFSTPFPIIFAFLHNKLSYIFPNQPKTQKWNIYTPGSVRMYNLPPIQCSSPTGWCRASQ